jgi:orotate phosphoribosyltransferase
LELAARVSSLCRLEGSFTLRSGGRATHYFDKYLFESDPTVLDAVAALAADLVPAPAEVLAGLELGGVPLVTALSRITALPAAFVRKQAKPYGTSKIVEGAGVAGRRVVVVEDVITTGGQVVRSTEQMRELGARIDTVVCAIDRSGGDHRALDGAGIAVRSVFVDEELM